MTAREASAVRPDPSPGTPDAADAPEVVSEADVRAVLAAVPADWLDVALAVAAAYQHRVTAAPLVAVTAHGLRTVVPVSGDTTVDRLVREVRDLRRAAGAAPATGAGRVRVSVAPAEADASERGPSFVFAFDEDSRSLRVLAESDAGWFLDERAAPHTARMGYFARRLLDKGADGTVDDADPLTPAEYHRIMHEWNGTAHPVPELTLPELVEASAAAHGDAVAVTHGGVRLTYTELNTRANRLARLLIAGGAGPGALVGMVLPRSVDFVVTALAIVKTGAAYLPVDTGLPVDRITGMLSDAGVSHVVSVSDLVPSVRVPAELVVLDDPATAGRLSRADASTPTDADRTGPLTADTPAYVLYTSGSTGRPKGVVVAHRAITNRLHHMQHQIPLGADDRLLQKTPAGFDVTVREVFWPLLAGATIVVAEPDGHRDPAYLVETITAEAVTIAHFVPSGLEVFLQQPGADACASLRRVVCGGEALPPELQCRFSAVLDADLFNVYGPTEAAVDVTSMLCPKKPGPGPVLIGSPVWNTRIYVLDERRRHVPPGSTGELHIAGVQLAEGYLGREDLTAERFVPDPYGAPGERMYRSGDLARWRPDGVLEFFGRMDHQVKVRGFRIELGEIESVILADDAVGQAVCVVREDEPGDQRLVVYVVAAPGAVADPGHLRARAAAVLPEYMVPSAVVVLEEFPLTANEKLDRKALPRPAMTAAAAGRPPSTPQEHLVAGLFTELLRVSPVGVEHDFFELGGSSLLAGRLLNEVHDRSGVRLRLRSLLQDSRVQAIAELITAEQH